MKHRYLIIPIVILLILGGCSEESTPPVTTTYEPPQTSTAPVYDKFSLWTEGTQLRGVNIYQRIVYPDVWDEPEVWGSGPLGPVFTQEDFDTLAAAGANYVVMSHPGLYDDKSPYNLNSSVQENLDKFISMAEKADLFVVIAFRTGPGRSEFSFLEVTKRDRFGKSHLNNEVWKDKSAQEKWVEMWRYAADRYRKNPAVIGYELMVEPNSNGIWLETETPGDFYPEYEGTTYDWNQLYKRISAGIREVDSVTPVLIGSMNWCGVSWLPYL
jgi:aryl-phospho-beta-D-glucosidase BglC (GH1 family)